MANENVNGHFGPLFERTDSINFTVNQDLMDEVN